MVYVPILKIDLPEPRLQELLPGLVTALLGACTLAFDAVYDLLHPLPPEGEEMLYAATIMHLPKEFRRARKRVVELDIRDEDKVSEELETAGYNFYRRRMREEVCGYSDELTEDLTFRRLMTPSSATRDIYGPTPLDDALSTINNSQEDPTAALLQLAADSPAGRAAAAAAALAGIAPPPSRLRRATVTTTVSGVGLALGVGVVKLVRLVSSRVQKQRRKAARAKRAAAAAAGQQQPGSRRQSDTGSTGGGVRGSRRSSSGTVAGAGGGRGSTPRQR